MTLALSILFLGIGTALLYVAFHSPQSTMKGAGDVMHAVMAGAGTSAYGH